MITIVIIVVAGIMFNNTTTDHSISCIHININVMCVDLLFVLFDVGLGRQVINKIYVFASWLYGKCDIMLESQYMVIRYCIAYMCVEYGIY